ncbi:MAG: glycosyltransferase family 2 protein [Flavihumibacter sp.]|nr:glycosyltransferase family 2 protein [Flavihumibacter sp.]
MASLPVIVLTPIKNESWILERFLAVTEQFADAIIVADQMSTDNSRDIVKQHPKAILIENNNPEYDELYRQQLLIDKARELFPGKKCLLALDADEIMTAASMTSSFWSQLNDFEEGTVLTFEKPDIISPVTQCIRYNSYFTLGYIDDGAPHTGRKIHSVRIPRKSDSPVIEIEDVKFMHYALTRTIEYRSRQRLYSVIENVKKIAPFYRRLLSYSYRLNDYVTQHTISNTPEDWFTGWERSGINMRTIQTSEVNNYTEQVLGYMQEYGVKQFYLDDIWDKDWDAFCRESYPSYSGKIKNIPFYRRWILDAIVLGFKVIKKVKG